jgi:hypothetical protein
MEKRRRIKTICVGPDFGISKNGLDAHDVLITPIATNRTFGAFPW